MKKNKRWGGRRLLAFALSICLMGGSGAFQPAWAAGSELSVGTAADSSRKTDPTGKADPAQAGDWSITGYEVYDAGSSGKTVDTLKKGRRVRIVVYLKSGAYNTEDVSKGNILVSRLRDSFKNGGSPKITVTSNKGDSLELKASFSGMTYSGKGSSLRLKVGLKNASGSAEELETEISEAESTADEDSASIAQPLIKVEVKDNPGPIAPGQKFTLVLNLRNTSRDADVEDLVANFNPGDSMFLLDSTNSRFVDRLNTKQAKEVRLEMQAGPDISGLSQAMDVELKYNYYSGGQLTSGTLTQKILIPLKGGSQGSGQPLIRISRSDTGTPITPGETFTVQVKLENLSQNQDIRNLTASFEPGEQLALLENTDSLIIGDLKAGQSAEIPIRLKAGGEMAADSVTAGVNLKFDYDSSKGSVPGTFSEKLVFQTAGGVGKFGSPTPNIIINRYSYGDRVNAGEVFDLSLELMNTSKESPVENVVVSLDTGEGISINSSSNTIFIPRLEQGGTVNKTIKVQALFQSKLQSPKITIAMRYEYLDKKERKQANSSETIAIPVYQPDRFEVKPPSFTDEIRQGEEATISLPYYNKGRGQVFNVEAKLEGEIQALDKDLNLGNFEAGKSGTIDFIVTPQKAGEFTGKVTVSYEDEAMKVKTDEIPITFTVADAKEVQGAVNPDDGMDQKPSAFPWLLILAAVLFLGGAVYVIKKKKKKAAVAGAGGAAEDEAEEYDEAEEEEEAEAGEDDDAEGHLL